MDIVIERAEMSRPKFTLSRGMKMIFRIVLVVVIVLVLIVLRVEFKYRSKIITADKISGQNIGLVFGAGLKAKGQPAAVLEDRIVTAIKLYQDGLIGKIIMSGDNQGENHNEVEAMKNYAESQGLPEEVLILDNAGTSTYASCENVKNVLGLNKVILITQKYHLPRALYLCNELGIDAVGVAARDRGYVDQLKFTLREFPANIRAWFSINFK